VLGKNKYRVPLHFTSVGIKKEQDLHDRKRQDGQDDMSFYIQVFSFENSLTDQLQYLLRPDNLSVALDVLAINFRNTLNEYPHFPILENDFK
jgi:hypothetical protein